MGEIDGDSGQAILIGGVLIAGVIIGVAVSLNGLAFSEDITIKKVSETGDPVRFVNKTAEAVRAGMSGIGGTPEEALNNYESYVGSYRNGTARKFIKRGVAVSVSGRDDQALAWVVGQKEVDEVTNISGDSDWVVAENVSEVYELNLNVSMSSVGTTSTVLMNVSTGSGAITADSGIDNGWAMGLKQSGSTLNVTADGYGNESSNEEEFTVTPEGGYATFDPWDVLEGEFNDTEAVRIENGVSVDASYDLRFGNDTDVIGPCRGEVCKGAEGQKRYSTGVVHKVEGIEVTYTNGEVRYNQTIADVRLGTNDANTETTKVYGSPYLKVEITGTTSPENKGNNIEVDYEVTNTGDEDASSAEVRLLIQKNGTRTVEDFDSRTVDSGDTETGTLTWNNVDGVGTHAVFVRTNASVDSTAVVVDPPSGPGISPGPVGSISVGGVP